MTRVKVLHIITRLIRGGGDENTLFTVNGLDPSRFEITLLTGGQSEPPMLARVAPHVLRFQVPDLVRDISPAHDARAFAQICQLIRERRYDIVHTHMAKGGIIGRLAARAAGAPHIIHTIHGQTFRPHLHPAKYALYWSLEKTASLCTHRFIAVGDELRSWYLEAGIAAADRYDVIRSGMDLRQFKAAARMSPARKREVRTSLSVPADGQIVGKVARLTEGKGHEYFLELAARVTARRSDTCFVALGSGELLDDFQASVKRRGLEGRVIAAGFRRDIADVLAALDIVVLTSLWEGLPRVLVQASSVGVPVVTFDVGGAREAVHDGRSGFIVPSKDMDSLAGRVLELLDDPEKARAMGKAGRELIDERWTIEHMVSSIEKVYDRVLAQGQARGRGSCGPT